MLEPGIREMVRPYRRLDLILTHFHLDHAVGLTYLPAVWAGRQVTIFAPSAPLVEAHAASAIDRLLGQPLFALRVREFPCDVNVVPLTGARVPLDGPSIMIRAQKHPGGSIGLRIDDTLAYLTDTEPGPVSFVEGVRLLMHEVWLNAEDARNGGAGTPGHSDVISVRELALRARVASLMPIHFHPGYGEQQLQAIATSLRGPGIEVLLPREGQIYEVL